MALTIIAKPVARHHIRKVFTIIRNPVQLRDVSDHTMQKACAMHTMRKQNETRREEDLQEVGVETNERIRRTFYK